MSSFRIDRQYVSFVTAETKSVSPAQPKPRAGADGRDADAGLKDGSLEALDGHCTEILERARKEADRKAAFLLQQARSKADAMVKQAEQRADEITGDAQERAAAIREEAKLSGYAEGQKNAQACAEERKKEEAKELSQMVDKLRGEYAGLVDGMRADIIVLVIDIVKKVINIRVEDSNNIFLGLINSALEQLKQTGTVIIHVGSADYVRYFGKALEEKSIHAGEAKLVVTEEEGYSPGDLVVETEGEMLDLSIDRQIERIQKAFLEEGD